MERSWTTTLRGVAAACGIALVALAVPAVTTAEEPWSAWSSSTVETAVDIGDPDVAPDVFGTDPNMDYVSAEEFICDDPANVCDYARCDSANYWCSDSHYVHVFAAVEVPAGALITGMRVFYYDNSGAQDFSVRLRNAYFGLGVRGDYEIQSWTSSGSLGLESTYVDVNPDVTVVRRYQIIATYGYRSYYLWVTLPPTLNVQFRGVAVYWYRQVSPAPASATFGDVATNHWAFQHVEALVDSGITSGCGSGNYCPDANVTRAQMAVFIAKALGLHWDY